MGHFPVRKLLVYQRIYPIIIQLSYHYWPTINPLISINIHYFRKPEGIKISMCSWFPWYPWRVHCWRPLGAEVDWLTTALAPKLKASSAKKRGDPWSERGFNVGPWTAGEKNMVDFLEKWWSTWSGWWFGTWMDYFFHHIGNVIIPTDELIFFRGVGQPPTSYCLAKGGLMWILLAKLGIFASEDVDWRRSWRWFNGRITVLVCEVSQARWFTCGWGLSFILPSGNLTQLLNIAIYGWFTY